MNRAAQPRLGHLFRSERHNAAMDAIADGIKSDRPPERFKNQNWKWSDFGPK
ncbi:MAG: hypothetical protein Q8M26_14465 [Pseudolabrys sp.]|nr:hypothetical protein [Pseudolabrys sp.]